MSALGELFTDIASAIRGKTGETGTMKPAEFPDKIAGIEAGSGGLGGMWKFATKTFTALEGQTFISHNCNVVPDIVILSAKTQILDTNNYSGIVYASGFSSRYLEFLKANNGKAYGEALITGMSGSEESGYEGTIITHYNDIAIESSSGYILGATSTKIGFAEALIDGASYEAKFMWFTGTFDAEEPSPMIKYVSFMNGTQLLFKMPVLVGDNCKNPVSTGDISTPKKESTEQYNYTFAGWGTTSSAVDSSCLENVLTDRTVYAVFNSSIRYYTINFYDGSTLLESQSVAYGDTPSIITPEKDGYSFNGWNPEITEVTGNANYYAVWSERVTFAGGTWADIARISEAGQAEEYFNLGDTKDIIFTDGDNSMILTVQIVGFNHDDLSDGSGKAGLSIMTTTTMNALTLTNEKDGTEYFTTCGITTIPWSESVSRRYLMERAKTWLPPELQSVLKTVNKISSIAYDNKTDTETTQDELWYPSYAEMGLSSSYTAPGQGTGYEYFTSNLTREKDMHGWDKTASTSEGYGTRSHNSWDRSRSMSITSSGGGSYKAALTNFPFGFCV